MSVVTDRVSDYVRKRGINIAKMFRDTKISYMALYDSLTNSERLLDLRDEEFLRVCMFLGIDPRDFADKSEKEVVCSWTKEVVARYKVSDILGEERTNINLALTEYLTDKFTKGNSCKNHRAAKRRNAGHK